MSVAEYFTRVKSLWDEIDDLRPLPTCTCTTNNFLKIQQDQRVMAFLMKLDPQFHQVRSNLLMSKDLPDVSEVYRMLLQEESHKELNKHHTPVEPMTFATYKWKPSHHTKPNHNGRRPSYFCDHCKIAGYNISRFFKLHGYPNNGKVNPTKKNAALGQNEECTKNSTAGNPLGLTTEQYTNLLSLLGVNKENAIDEQVVSDSSAHLAGPLSLLSNSYNTQWIVDSGSTDHICNDLTLFTNIKDISISHHKITTLDGPKHEVSKKGNIALCTDILLKDVLFVPTFHFNLISVHKICLDLVVNITFSHHSCFL